jgi:hypothetical protein
MNASEIHKEASEKGARAIKGGGKRPTFDFQLSGKPTSLLNINFVKIPYTQD